MTDSAHGPVECSEHFLNSSVPLQRQGLAKQSKLTFSMRAYFKAVEKFLIQNLGEAAKAATLVAGIEISRIDAINIVAEKHGSDYHPARIVIQQGEKLVNLAVNVALTERGQHRMKSECHALSYLAENFLNRFIPRFFFSGSQSLLSEEGVRCHISMFLAEWFDDFHEFHLGVNPKNLRVEAFLWDPQSPGKILSQRELSQIYKQASYILTYYYDAISCSEIYPWHHAAGDFVVSTRKDSTKVRLITVRQYAPRIVMRQNTIDGKLTGLLMFLVNMTLRMRLDREHGTGNILWAQEHTVKDTITGFAEALLDQVAERRMDFDFFQQIIDFLRSIAPDELTSAFLTIIDSYNPAAPDIPIIMTNLEQHIYSVFRALKTLRLP